MGRWWLVAALPLLMVGGGQVRGEESLYVRLGGQAGVARIVEGAVTRWYADARVKADFENTEPGRLKARVADQLCVLAGGPCTYRGRPMGESHAGLGVTEARFNAVAEDLMDAMAAEGVPYWTQNRLIALLAPMRREIVTR